MIATLELVELRRGGGVLTSAVSAGAITLPVDVTLDYDEAGGLLELNGQTYAYTGVTDTSVILDAGPPPVVWTNLATQPSFEASVSQWSAQAGSNAPAQSTTRAFSGTTSMLVARGSGTSTLWANNNIASNTVVSKTYTVSARLWVPASNPSNGGLRVSGTGVVALAETFTTTRDGWARVSVTFTRTAGAGTALFYVNGGTSGQIWVDTVTIFEGTDPGPEFDGDTPDTEDDETTTTYAWTGTPYASTSTMTVTSKTAVQADADVDTPVWTLDAEGNREETWKAWLDLGDGGDTVPATIPTDLIGYFPEGDTATGQKVEVTDDASRVLSRPAQQATLDGSVLDPSTPIPGAQSFSEDAPTITDGYPEGHGWWQVDAGDVLGFWRLVGGVWTAQTIVTVDALEAGNVLVEALSGKTVTGTTVQTRDDQNRGIKLGDINGVEALIAYTEAGVPFIKAVPEEGLAVIAGEIKAVTTTVTDGASLGGRTEVTRHPDGSAGAVVLTAYTTAPKSAPTVTTGYDTVQFTDDGLWPDRRGWSTDGTYWYTANTSTAKLEKWDTGGSLVASTVGTIADLTGVIAHSGKLYAIRSGGTPQVFRYAAATLAFESMAYWMDASGSRVPTVGVDAGTGDLLIAQSRATDDKVRIRRYTMPVTSGDALVAGASVDTSFAYARDLRGITYGTHDLGANRYIFTDDANGRFQVVDSTGTAAADEDWQAGMSPGKVGFTFTGGVFKSMDQTGLMRTYTDQDAALPIGSAFLTKWVSNTLANATYETDQSPRAKVTIPKRTKLNVTTSAINTGGTNAPDRVKVYVGRGSTEPARTAMWKQTDPAVGVTTIAYSSQATSGTNPPATNGFIAAGGTVQRLELADGTVFIDGLGAGTAWTTYTPTFTAATTNPTLANFTISGRYARIGRKTVAFSIVITANAASGYGTGTYDFGLPVAARAANEAVVHARQASPAKVYIGSGETTTTVRLIHTDTSGLMNSTSSAIQSGTVISISGTYEAA